MTEIERAFAQERAWGRQRMIEADLRFEAWQRDQDWQQRRAASYLVPGDPDWAEMDEEHALPKPIWKSTTYPVDTSEIPF